MVWVQKHDYRNGEERTESPHCSGYVVGPVCRPKTEFVVNGQTTKASNRQSNPCTSSPLSPARHLTLDLISKSKSLSVLRDGAKFTSSRCGLCCRSTRTSKPNICVTIVGVYAGLISIAREALVAGNRNTRALNLYVPVVSSVPCPEALGVARWSYGSITQGGNSSSLLYEKFVNGLPQLQMGLEGSNYVLRQTHFETGSPANRQ